MPLLQNFYQAMMIHFIITNPEEESELDKFGNTIVKKAEEIAEEGGSEVARY
jgi:hypothetical protein